MASANSGSDGGCGQDKPVPAGLGLFLEIKPSEMVFSTACPKPHPQIDPPNPDSASFLKIPQWCLYCSKQEKSISGKFIFMIEEKMNLQVKFR